MVEVVVVGAWSGGADPARTIQALAYGVSAHILGRE